MKSNYDIAIEVLQGKWNNGTERKRLLTEAGYNYEAIQSIVNSLIKDGYTPESVEVHTEQKILEVDFDPEKYQGIMINIIV